MAVKAFELFGTIDLQSGKMQAGLKSASKQVDDFERRTKASIRSVESAWSKFSNSNFSQGFLSGFGIQRGQGLDALAGGAVASLVSSGIQQGIEKMRDLTARGMEYYDTVRLTTFAFTNLLGNQEKAKKHVADLLQFARVTPFDDVPVIKYAQALESVKVRADYVTTALRGIGNALVASGQWGISQQEGVMLGFQQLLGSPTLRTEEITRQIRNYIPTIMADWSSALGITRDEFRKRLEEQSIKSMPAFELLIDYYNKNKKGGLEFAGEKTARGLTSSKTSAEDRAFANMIAGGDVMDPKEGPGAEYLRDLTEQIKRRDEFAKPGELQNALGELATAYLRARDKDDETLFAVTRSSAAGGAGSVVTKTATKVSDNMLAPPGFFLGESIGETIAPGWKGIPGAEKFNPSWEDLGNAPGNLIGWAKSLFTGATASAINSVEQGKDPMKAAGAGLGGAAIAGIKSPDGLDSNSPSKKAIEEGRNVRLGLVQGMLDPSIDVAGASVVMASEAFSGFGRRGSGFVGGMSERQYLEQASKNPTVQAFFEAIKKAEGGDLNIMAGGRRVNSGALHPGEVVPMSQWFRTSKGPSSAAGFYQITRTNWRNLAPQLGLDNFSDPHQQLIAAMKLFADRGGMPALLSGNIEAALNIAALDWTSTPGSTIGGGKQLSKSRWMGYFNQARSSGDGSPAAPISPSNPLPVTIVDAGNAVDFRSGPSFYDYQDPGLASQVSTARNMYAARRQSRAGAIPSVINDPVPVNVDVIGSASTLTTTFIALNEKALAFKKPLEMLGESATAAAGGLGSISVAAFSASSKEGGGLSDAEIAAMRAEALSAGQRKKKRDKLFDSTLTREGVAGDFHGGLSNLLGSLGWEQPGSLGRQFGLGLLKDIQARWAHDLSSSITGMLFGGRGEDGSLSGGFMDKMLGRSWGNFDPGFPGSPSNSKGGGGGFLSSIFGKLFGGFRESGGGMQSGRFYVAGENGPEIVTGPGYVHNASQTRSMMSGGDTHVMLAIGDRAVADMNDHYLGSRRGTRKMIRLNARYGRKIAAWA